MNPGFSDSEIQKLREATKQAEQSYVLYNEEERTEDSVSFKFVGEYKGKPVIFDAFLYTLQAEFESQLYDWAQEQVEEDFPGFAWENDSMNDSDAQESFRILINDNEARENLAVSEFIEFDDSIEYGIGLDACLKLEAVTNEDVEKFVRAFNRGELKLDNKPYTFKTPDEEAV